MSAYAVGFIYVSVQNRDFPKENEKTQATKFETKTKWISMNTKITFNQNK